MDLGFRVIHVSYPDAPLRCVRARVWVSWVGLGCHGDDSSVGSGEELKMSTACFHRRLSSLLCTLTHTSLTLNHLSQSVSDWASNFFIYFISHACLEACLFVNWIIYFCLWNLCLHHCWLSWFAVLNGLHFTHLPDAMLPFMAIMFYACVVPHWMKLNSTTSSV